MRHDRIARYAAATLAALALATTASAHPFVVDQQCLPESMGGYNAILMGPLAQEFVPASDRLDVAVLFLEHDPSSPLGSIGVSVRVRDGALDGPVLGESAVTPVARGTFGLVHFDLAAPVSLVPGGTYLLEIVQHDAGGTLMAWTSDHDAYPSGRAFLLGRPQSGADFLFQTGLDVTLPVTRASWGEVKTRGW